MVGVYQYLPLLTGFGLRSVSSTPCNTTAAAAVSATASSSVDLDAWLDKQYDFCQQRIVNNIVPNPGAPTGAKGILVASPSTSQPDYYYQWTRDMAIVYGEFMEEIVAGKMVAGFDAKLYAQNTKIIQRVSNPSGGLDTGGLGEPKFMVDNTAFTGEWGRPQTDGPALRAKTLGSYYEYLIKTQSTDEVLLKLLYSIGTGYDSVLGADVEFVYSNLETQTFDLWEEVKGDHFFTTLVQARALEAGVAVAIAAKDKGHEDRYKACIPLAAKWLQEYWRADKGYISASKNAGSRSGLDAAVLIASLHSSEAIGFGPSSPKILATHYELVESFRSLYAINKGAAANEAVAIGRYPEDVYDGVGKSQGHPWFIATAAAAEVVYRAVVDIHTQQTLVVTEESLKFWRRFDAAVAVGSYGIASPQCKKLLGAAKVYADGFLQIVKKHATNEGYLSEQFSRDDGYQRGAKELSWSYSALRAAIKARRACIATGV